MTAKQISNLEAIGIECLVFVCVLVMGLLMLSASGYFFFCVILYIVAALPLSVVGALLGKMLTQMRLGIWAGAWVVVILGYAWLFSMPNYYYCEISD